jgi:hypothetical protein
MLTVGSPGWPKPNFPQQYEASDCSLAKPSWMCVESVLRGQYNVTRNITVSFCALIYVIYYYDDDVNVEGIVKARILTAPGSTPQLFEIYVSHPNLARTNERL